MLFDSHAHVNFNAFKDDGNEVLKKCLDNNVWVINVGSEYRTSKRAVEYADKFEKGIYAAVGLHPIHIEVESEKRKAESDGQDVNNEDIKYREKFDYQKYLALAQSEKVVAIGEVGLDYHHFNTDSNNTNNIKNIIKKQKYVFEKFIDLANEVQKPMAVHCWGADSRDKDLVDGADAYADLFEILEKHPLRLSGTSPSESGRGKGVIHSFIGSWKNAQKFIDLGYKIGLNGIVTYSESYDKLIRNTELKDIIIETDCPYLTPKPLERDIRNEPINVKYVAEKIAYIKNILIEEVEKVTTNNAKKLFGIE